MEKVLMGAFLVALSVAVQGLEDLKMNAGSTYVHLKPKGSAFISKQPDIFSDTNRIMVKIDKLEQFTSDGSSVQNEDLNGLNFVAQSPPIQSNNALQVRAASTNKINSGTLEVILAIFTKSTDVSFNGEDTTLLAGDIGVKLKLKDYAFSKSDNKLKMTLKVKGMSASPTEITTNKGTDGLAYDLGSNGVLKLSKKVKLTATGQYEDGAVTANGDEFTIEFANGTVLEYNMSIKPAFSGKAFSGSSGTNLGLAMMSILMLLRTVY